MILKDQKYACVRIRCVHTSTSERVRLRILHILRQHCSSLNVIDIARVTRRVQWTVPFPCQIQRYHNVCVGVEELEEFPTSSFLRVAVRFEIKNR